LHEQQKVKGITLKEGLFKWKQFQIYVKLCTKIMQKEHDVPCRVPWGKNCKGGCRKEILHAQNEARCKAFYPYTKRNMDYIDFYQS